MTDAFVYDHVRSPRSNGQWRTGGVLSFIETVGLREFVARCEQLARLHGPRFKPTRRLRERARDGERFHALPGAGAAA